LSVATGTGLYPGTFALTDPDRLAVIRPATGESLTYRELDEQSTRLANHLRSVGMKVGDNVAMVSTNGLPMLVVYWAALRSGFYVTAVNHHLTAAETNYILDDCECKVLFASADAADAVAASDAVGAITHRIAWGGDLAGFAAYTDVLAAASAEPLVDQPRGQDFLYSSGTTGVPKGVRIPLRDGQVDQVPDPYTPVFATIYAMDETTVYLSPAPLYHAAPLRFCGVTNSVGGLVVMMDRFDPEAALQLIDEHQVTHSQWVPTMFVRMLKLPEVVRDQYDVTSLRYAVHAAAPCPPEVKRSMIDWWGPVIHEYWASTEGAGITLINSTEALERPGSVGRAALGVLRICDESGTEVPSGQIGTIYVEREELPFEYFKDAAKTASVQHAAHPTWTTTGDVGYLDGDGYLYLTDRGSFMIISGGVNIYPQEAENVLILHPAVYDIGIIGIPDPEMGEQVKACVQLADGYSPSEQLAQELIDFVKTRLAGYKAPKSVDFVDDLPRSATGKMVKRKLKERYV
jgi:long-chain acyl-CoA synthetase